jgi:hypothetical protein
MSLETPIMIKTIDNIIIPFNVEVIKSSIIIKNIIETLDSDDNIIPLMNEKCTNEVIQKIKIFLEYIYYNNIEKNALDDFITSKGYTKISEWFHDFINMDKQMLFDIVIVADYLDIKCLLDFGCWAIANQIKNSNIV